MRIPSPIPSLFDGLGMGLCFSLALTCIGAVRDPGRLIHLPGFRMKPPFLCDDQYFSDMAGAIFVLAALTAWQNYVKN